VCHGPNGFERPPIRCEIPAARRDRRHAPSPPRREALLTAADHFEQAFDPAFGKGVSSLPLHLVLAKGAEQVAEPASNSPARSPRDSIRSSICLPVAPRHGHLRQGLGPGEDSGAKLGATKPNSAATPRLRRGMRRGQSKRRMDLNKPGSGTGTHGCSLAAQ
jgi:hypothetical protein